MFFDTGKPINFISLLLPTNYLQRVCQLPNLNTYCLDYHYLPIRWHTSRRRLQPSAPAFIIVGLTDCPWLSDQRGWWPWATVLFWLPAVDSGTVYRMKSPLLPHSLSSVAVLMVRSHIRCAGLRWAGLCSAVWQLVVILPFAALGCAALRWY